MSGARARRERARILCLEREPNEPAGLTGGFRIQVGKEGQKVPRTVGDSGRKKKAIVP